MSSHCAIPNASPLSKAASPFHGMCCSVDCYTYAVCTYTAVPILLLGWWWWCGLILAVPEWPVRCLLTAARFYKLYEQREVRPLFQRPFQGFVHLVCSLGNTRFVALIGRLEMKQFVHLEPHFRHDFVPCTLVYNKRATIKCEGRNSNTTCTV